MELAVNARKLLKEKGIDVRVVSVPCAELFDRQPEEYREKVLPSDVRARVAVEMGSPDSWYRYVGLDGKTIAMTTFGASAPFRDLLVKFGFTAERVDDETEKQHSKKA